MERLDSTGDNACTVCHDTMNILAVGHCDHPVCYKCSTRMRVLCEQMDCPICRSTMPQVAFVYDKVEFKDIDLRRCIPNRKNKIFYESEEIEDMYLDLLEFRCRECPKRKPERTFAQLQTHMRREHQLFACDICLEHLKIFPYETKFYDRKSLAGHRRVGDVDDKSYKGHPLCEFCDARYLDKDELMKHLRKDHFFCHFCDQQGSNAYYNDYPDLLVHFGDSHFLCTEDECGSSNTRFTHAFSSEIDLKSHKATIHNMKSREMRTIQVDFYLAPRHQGYSRGNGTNSDDYYEDNSYRHRIRNDRYGNRRRHHDDPNLHRALEASLQESTKPPPVEEQVPDPIQDFPTLSGLAAPQVQQKSVVKSRKEDFPSLGSSNNKAQKTATVKSDAAVLSARAQKPTTGASNRVEDFPGLSARAQKPTTAASNRIEDFPGLTSLNIKTNKASAGNSKHEDFPGLATSNIKVNKSIATSKREDFTDLASNSKVNKTTVGPSKREEDFPVLSISKSSNKNSVNKNYATITHLTSDAPRPVIKKEKPRESKPVSLGTVKHATKERWTSQAQSMTDDEDDYPSLKGKSKSGSRGAGDNTSSSWLQKSSVTEVPLSSSAAPTVSMITEKPKENAESQSKKSAPKVKPFSVDNEFPSLGGGKARQTPVPGNISWSKPASNSNQKKGQNTKFDNRSFESSDEYQSHRPQSEQYKANNKSSGEKDTNGNLKKNITINKKDFPGLPKGDIGIKQSTNNKKQAKVSEVKKVETKPAEVGGHKPKKNKKGPVDKSLNDIASGLMNLSTGNSKSNEKKSNTVDENGNKQKASKNVNAKISKPDWFDKVSSNNDNNSAEKPNNESAMNVDIDNSFPSVHAMSSSVQSTSAPPGFSPTSFHLQQPQNTSAPPPGFSNSAPPGLSKPTFSACDYILPTDFTNRNQDLVQNIRSCLETVEDGFDKFKAFSFQFRQGNISSSAYYTNCQLLIGDSDFNDIFPELLALLPDINKQQELWFEHQVVASGRSKGQSKSDGFKNLSPCSKCGQIVLNDDLQDHHYQHEGNGMDFPSLGSVSSKGGSNGATSDRSANRPLKGAWIKATT